MSHYVCIYKGVHGVKTLMASRVAMGTVGEGSGSHAIQAKSFPPEELRTSCFRGRQLSAWQGWCVLLHHYLDVHMCKTYVCICTNFAHTLEVIMLQKMLTHNLDIHKYTCML